MCVLVCMLGCRFVNIHECMCPRVFLLCMCVQCACMHLQMFVYILCDTLYVHVLTSC